MAKRMTKKDDVYTILSFEQVDTHLVKLGQLQQDKTALEAEADRMIAHVKMDLKRQVAPLTDKIQKHLRSLEVFCGNHRLEFGPRQSRRQLFGVIGWRKSTAVVVKKTTLEKIRAVFKARAAAYLHIKEAPNKEALAKLDDTQLAAVDSRGVQREEFFGEPDLTRIDLDVRPNHYAGAGRPLFAAAPASRRVCAGGGDRGGAVPAGRTRDAAAAGAGDCGPAAEKRPLGRRQRGRVLADRGRGRLGRL